MAAEMLTIYKKKGKKMTMMKRVCTDTQGLVDVEIGENNITMFINLKDDSYSIEKIEPDNKKQLGESDTKTMTIVMLTGSDEKSIFTYKEKISDDVFFEQVKMYEELALNNKSVGGN